nr:hypothetical protein [Tanacetum cinerariifolium]
MEREQEEAQRKRQQEVLESAKFYTADNWLNIQAQVEANASLSKTLLGDDVFEDNFPARMAALIKKKRQALVEQSFKERQNRPLTPAQQKAYMRQKSIARKPMIKPKSKLPTLDLDATAQTFLKVIVDEDSDDEEYVDEVWSAVVGWELISTLLGEVNALYRIDGTTKHFTTLRQILHLVDCQDLMRLYGLVVQHYEHHPAVGSELASPEQTDTGKDILNPFMAVMICQKSLGYFNSPMIQVLRVGLVINPPGYVVPTGRVIVPAGRYIVPTGSIIVTADRYIVSAGSQLTGIQFHQLELSLGNIPSRSFRPTKTAEIFWQIWASRLLGVPLALDRSWNKWEPFVWLFS